MKDIRYSPLISLRIFVLLLQLWFLLYPIMVWLRFLSYIILIFLLQELEVARLEICPLLIMQEGFQSKDLEVPLLKLNVIAISNFWENIWHTVLTTKNGVCRRHPFVLVSKFYNTIVHSALKLEKKCNFKSTKTHFLPFLKMQIMCFCTFEIVLFSNFRRRFQALLVVSQMTQGYGFVCINMYNLILK